jgi:hypothetical protein
MTVSSVIKENIYLHKLCHGQLLETKYTSVKSADIGGSATHCMIKKDGDVVRERGLKERPGPS